MVVVAAAFEGVSRVQQQRMVNDALKPLTGGVHSISMVTATPAKWREQKEKELR